MNEHYVCICSNSIYVPALISCLSWCQVLCGCMRNYFLCRCIMLSTGVAIRICNCSCMMSCLVMIAFSVECKSANQSSWIIVKSLEILPTIDIFQIFCQCIATASYYKVKNIWSYTNSDSSSDTQISSDIKVYSTE